MNTVGGILLLILSYILIKIGFSAGDDSANHEEYGVESESLHKGFAFVVWVGGLVAGFFGIRVLVGA